MTSKKNSLGKVVGQVMGLRVRQTTGTKTRTGTTSGQISIFAGKNKVEGPFKTKELAMNRAKALTSQKVVL